MSIGALADAVVRRLVPQVRAGACLAPEPCGPCGPGTGPYCYGGRMAILYYTAKVTNCSGVCAINKRTLCKVVYTGGPC
jgi:hypothetical protein